MLNKVKKYIKYNNLFSSKDRILVAISGGADSVALTHLLHKLEYKIILAHCNFNLREKNSDEDEHFVKDLANSLNLEVFIKSFKTKEYAKQNKYSIEEAARILRYNWFEELRKEKEIKYIATAHHLDDKIETFFINLTAGTGIKGIRSISNKKNNIIRPLLFANRYDIEKWCSENSINYRTDKSNFDNKFIRNRFRNKIIPLFKEINSSFNETMFKNFQIFSDFEKIYNNYIEKAVKKILTYQNKIIYLNIKELLEELAPITSLFELISPYGFNSAQTIDILTSLESKQAGKLFYSDTYRLLIDREFLIIKKIKEISNKEYFIKSEQKEINTPLPLHIETHNFNNNFKIKKDKNIAYFDADKITFPLIIRTKKKADNFNPFGMKGRKLVSDYYTDIKLNLFEKEETYILVSNKDIIWIIGYRTDDRYKITQKTKRVLKIVYKHT